MEIVLLALIAFAVVAFISSQRSKRRQQEELQRRVDGVKSVASEDVTRLGEEVSGLDLEVGGRPMDEGLRQDYQRALDAYEHSKAALDAVQVPDDIKNVTQAVEDGRYAAACVRARVNGQPLPQRRPPCFFNPAHGPSTEDVEWAPAGGQARPVPVCAADAERVRAGAEPASRQVLVGGQRRPYWEAGPDYAPWARGYYGGYQSSGLLPGVLMGALLGSTFGGFGMGPFGMGGWGMGGGYGMGYDSGYDSGYEAGQDNDNGGDNGSDNGGADGGDYDQSFDSGNDFGGFGPDNGGGFDFGGGGGDWGGGDFGGGDFGGGGDW